MKHLNLTFSISEDLKRFISSAIRKALNEEKLKKEKDLEVAYEASSIDIDRLEVLKDWDSIEDISNGDDEDWSWLK